MSSREIRKLPRNGLHCAAVLLYAGFGNSAFQCFFDLHHDGALHALAEQFAAGLINAADGSAGMICIGRAATGTVELRPAVFALFPGICIAGTEGFTQFGIGHTVPDIAELILLIADELMAGIEITHGVTAMYSVPDPQPERRL